MLSTLVTRRSASPGLGWIAVVGLVGTLAAVGATLLDVRLMVPLALALPLASATVLLEQPRSLTRPARAAGERLDPPGWLVPAWLAVAFVSDLRLISRGQGRSSYSVLAGNLSGDVLLEILATLLICAAFGFVLLRGWEVPVAPVAVLALAYPGLAVLSIGWSDLPPVSIARAGQLAAVGVLGAYTAGWAIADPEGTRRRLRTVYRWFVFAVLVLLVYALVTPDWWDGRLRWPGTHPIVATILMGVALLGVLASDDRRALLWPLPPILVVGALATGIMMAQSRGPIAAVFAGAVAIGVVHALRDPRFGIVFAAVGAAGCAVVGAFAFESVMSYLLRGRSFAEVFGGLSGRGELWSYVLDNPIGSQLWGVGVGANRVALLQEFSWAGSAHSAFLDLLQTLGMLGMAVGVAVLVALGVQGLRRRNPHTTGLVAFVTVVSIATPGFSQPGIVVTALFLALGWLYVEPAEEPTATG